MPLHFFFLNIVSFKYMSNQVCFFLHQVLDGSESQYSGMQIGTLQDEEEEGTTSSTHEEAPESFLHSALGTFLAEYQTRGTGSVLVILISVAALSKPHLFDSRGHNRQGSDGSVDCFTPKEEPPEPEPDNKVPTLVVTRKEEAKIQADHVGSVFDRLTCFCYCSCRGLKAPSDIILTRGWSRWCTVYGFCLRRSC